MVRIRPASAQKTARTHTDYRPGNAIRSEFILLQFTVFYTELREFFIAHVGKIRLYRPGNSVMRHKEIDFFV